MHESTHVELWINVCMQPTSVFRRLVSHIYYYNYYICICIYIFILR